MLRDLIASSRAARLLRLDEFVEDDHPRDESGKFAAAGGHASEAESHATRARTAASGTTPAARASARKAEASAELARAAAGRGHVEEARRHADEARRHADAVVAKVAAAGVARVAPKSEAPPSKVETKGSPTTTTRNQVADEPRRLAEAREQMATHGHLGYVGPLRMYGRRLGTSVV